METWKLETKVGARSRISHLVSCRLSDGTVTVEVVVTAPGAEPVRATGELRLLSPGQRVRRVIAGMVGAVLFAALLIPIPIIHLVGIPLVLLAGIVLAVRSSRSVAILTPMRIACPRCGASNSLGGGLGISTATGPIARDCESCRRQLEIRFLSRSPAERR